MGRIWLACCADRSYPLVRREVTARDPSARFLRLAGGAEISGIAGALGNESAAAIVYAGDFEPESTAEMLRQLHTGSFDDVLVVTGESDGEQILRFFQEGATEVIAARGVIAPAECDSVQDRCDGMREGPPTAQAGDSLACDDTPVANGAEAQSVMGTPQPIMPAASSNEAAAPRPTAEARTAREPQGPRAPMVAVVAGRGGCGKTTIAAALAACAARAGLRVAVLDLDLMFGNMREIMGAEGFRGIEGLGANATEGGISEQDVEETAMRIGPGLTLWGPCAAPERAEFVSGSVEQLIMTLRKVADVVFVDTSTFWSDTAAMAVAACDRCLVVGTAGTSSVISGKRVIDLAARIGVPRTKMTCVFNRLGARGCGEEQALHFEMGVSLRSRARIADGGDEVAGMLSFGHLDKLIAGSGAFSRSIRSFTCKLMRELGCPIDQWLLDEEQRRAAEEGRPRLRLPWGQKTGERR